MNLLQGKNILLGVTGGIAAYKTTYLVRLLIKAGAQVQVVMTPTSREFVTPLSLSTLSQRSVLSSFTNTDDPDAQWNNHVELGLWADLMIIAPATSNTMGKMVQGIVDNLLLGVYSSAKCPVFIAPAMDLDMYKHPANQANLKALETYGNYIIPAESGFLASGLEGTGRMAEPETIVRHVQEELIKNAPLAGKHVLVTAGPTHEALDPVRFLGNRSSGKMGFALARQAAALGARVTLVSGPSALTIDNSQVTRVDVTSARDMYDAVHAAIEYVDIAIFAAAVADYRPANTADQKIKKKEGDFTIQLVRNPDILASVGALSRKPITVGFAMETENGHEAALGKLERKNCDFLALNMLNDAGAGFQGDTNAVQLYTKGNTQPVTIPLSSKDEVALTMYKHLLQHPIFTT